MIHRIRSAIPDARGTARRAAALALTLVLTTLGACSDDATGPDAAPGDDLAFGQIIFQNPDGGIFYSHGDHWHGALRVETGGERTLRVYFIAEYQESHGSPPQDLWFTLEDETEYRLRVTIHDPTLASWTGGRHEGLLAGKYPGSTGATIEILRGTRVVWTVPTVPVVVTDPA